jgi:hypothetical protein
MDRACSTHEVRRGTHIAFWWESHTEKDHQENLEVGGRIVLKLMLEK